MKTESVDVDLTDESNSSLSASLNNSTKAKKTTCPQKICTKCGQPKSLENFYSKGHRVDSSCKSCVLSRKKKSYKIKTAKANLTKAVRKNSKILTFTNEQIEEKAADDSQQDLLHLENLLRQFIFNSICLSGERDEKE